MQVIRCTAKMLKELGIQKAELAFVEDDGFLGSWFANLLKIDRRKCILFTNSETLYSFLVPGILKLDLLGIEQLFCEYLVRYLKSEGVEAKLPDIESDLLPVVIAKTNSKSVLGSMNDISFQFETYIQAEGGLSSCKIREIHRKVNRCPMSPIRYSYPIECLKERLNRIST
ncbi:MAG: hypothetical protein KAJ19_27180 [Gammaproteobacteria bacterium]|nr:hypothetical protein [Gammaproteobacteria bacterium]